jgi:hypothetical protein
MCEAKYSLRLQRKSMLDTGDKDTMVAPPFAVNRCRYGIAHLRQQLIDIFARKLGGFLV